MQIEIPQYIEAYVGFVEGVPHISVYIGDAMVYVHVATEEEEDLAWEELKLVGVTAFGKMLALKIGD